MKKLLLLFLLIAGGVSTASADNYSIQFNQDASWYKLCDLTDEDGDGVYSAIVNLEVAEKLNWDLCTIQLCTGTSLADGWTNALWANFESDASILSYDYFTLSETYTNGGKLQIPIKSATFDTYAIKFDYNSSDKTIRATRLIEFASSNDDWHSSNPVYMAETAHNSGIFQETMILPANTEFKFISNNNGGAGWYGNKDNSSITTDGSNIKINKDGVYTITANFNNTYVAPALVNVPASVGTYGMATLCSEYALDFTGLDEADVKAYAINDNDKAAGTLSKTQVTGKVPAGTGLYIEGAANASINVPTTICTDELASNMLKGVTSNTDISQTESTYTNYILTVNTVGGTVGTPKFYKVNTAGNTVLAGKAYLQIPTAKASRESFWFDNDVTAIEKNLTPALNEGVVYDLQGRRVAQPMKGLYIVNGKKVIK